MNIPTFILTVLILGSVIYIIYRQFQTKGHCEQCETDCIVKHSQNSKSSQKISSAE